MIQNMKVLLSIFVIIFVTYIPETRTQGLLQQVVDDLAPNGDSNDGGVPEPTEPGIVQLISGLGESTKELLTSLPMDLTALGNLGKCFEQNLEGLKCNFNFSINPFLILQNCGQNEELIMTFQESFPPITADIAVPYSDTLCTAKLSPNSPTNNIEPAIKTILEGLVKFF